MLQNQSILLKIIIFSFFVFFLQNANSQDLDVHTKLWLNGVFIGPLSPDKKIKYYIEPNFRFIDDPYKFEQGRLYIGLGYGLLSNLVAYGGAGWVINKNLDGTLVYEERIWQQVNWDIIKSKNSFSLSSRTRLEERRNEAESPWALRLREKISTQIPLKELGSKKYSLDLFDEGFFNLVRPSWVDQKLFSENRAFIGIGKRISKSMLIDVGYINQYQYTSPRKMSNGLYIALNIQE